MRTRQAIAGGGVLVAIGPALRIAGGDLELLLVMVVFGAATMATLVGVARRTTAIAALGAIVSVTITAGAAPEARSSLFIVLLGALAAAPASVPEAILPGRPPREVPIARVGLALVLVAQVPWSQGHAAATVAALVAAIVVTQGYRWLPGPADRAEHRLSRAAASLTRRWLPLRRRLRWRRAGVPTTPVHHLRELDRFQRAFTVAVIAAMGVTAVTLLHTLHGGGWTPVGDEANQIYGAQLAHVYRPLLGDLNTANFYGNPSSHHPGPMAWYVLAPWVRHLGPQTGAWVFAVLWNVASILTAAWLAFRSGGFRPGAVLLVASLTAFALGAPGQFASTFFQVLPLLPLLVSLVGSWALARGDTIAFPIVAVAATFVVQSATLNLPIVLLCATIATISAGRRLRAGMAVDGRVRWHLGLGVGALVVLWLPTAWDQLFETGNLGKLLEADIPHDGVSGVLDLVHHARSTLEPLPSTMVQIGALAVTVTVAFALATRRRAWRAGGDRALALVVATALLGSAITAALLPADDVENTHLMWVPIVMSFLTMAALTAVLGDRTIPRPTQAVGVVCTAFALAFALPLLREPREVIQAQVEMAAVEAMLPDIVEAVPPGGLGLTFRGGFSGGRIAQGLLPRLAASERIGYLSNDLVARDAPSLVVIRNEQTPWQEGRVLASYQPPPDPSVPSDLLEQVHRWASDHGPIVLAPHRTIQVANVLDGQVASACIDDLLAAPDLLLDLPPRVLASLYAATLVTAPDLPAPVLSHLWNWHARQPVQILEPTATESRSGEMIFTRSSC